MASVEDSVPYPWPFDAEPGTLDATRLALVVAGAQLRWRTLDDAPAVLERVERLAAALRTTGALVVWIRHAGGRRAGRAHHHLPRIGAPDADLAAAVAPDDLVVDAPGFDGFTNGRLDLELRAAGRDRLAIAGLGAEVLVDGTLRSANDRGYECLTLRDALAAHDPLTGAHALASITMSGGIFGAVGSTEGLLAALGVPALEVHR